MYEDIIRFTRAVPFRPFRVVLIDGRVFTVRYPDMILPTRTRVVLAHAPAAGPADAVERVEYLSPDRIRAVEPEPHSWEA